MSAYFLSLDADTDLQSIYLYSEEVWGERQARRYLSGLYEAFDGIARNPETGRLRGELGDGIRSVPHGSHVVFFMMWKSDVAILRVLHGAMDLESRFANYDPLPGIDGKRSP